MAARLALVLRRPLWFDEIFTVWAARLPFDALLAVLSNDSGPPLFYVLEKPFVLAAERLRLSDAAARAIPFAATAAVFGGALALPSRASRLRFVLLAAASPFLLLYSAEARAYAQLAVLCLALFLLACVARETPKGLAATALVSAAALYTHYLAIFAVGAAILVAAAEKRTRAALAALGGGLTFLFWLPILARQPPEAVAWMREPAGGVVLGILSALGGAGRVPPPLGPPLPAALVAIGALIGVLATLALVVRWRSEPEIRRAIAFLGLFFAAAALGSLAGPIAFAGRTEVAVLPVWLWAIAHGAERSRFLRVTLIAAILVAAAASVMLVAAPRARSLPARTLDALASNARPGDVLFAGGHFYLPARLASDRGRLGMPVRAFPLDQAAHPGWSVGARLRAEDFAAVAAALRAAGPNDRMFFLVPPSYVDPLRPVLESAGVAREVVSSPPEMVLLGWSRR